MKITVNEKAEKIILGMMLNNKSAFYDSQGVGLKTKHFYSDLNRKVFETIETLAIEGREFSLVEVGSKLGREFPIDYLVELSTDAPITVDSAIHAQEVVNTSYKREIAIISNDLMKKIENHKPYTDMNTLLSEASQTFLNLNNSHVSTLESENIADTSEKLITEIERRCIENGKGKPIGLATGIEKLDENLQITGKRIYLIGARTSMGKTTLALNFATKFAMDGKHVLFFTNEMSEEELLEKCVSNIGKIDSKALGNGDMNENQLNKFMFAVGKIVKTNLCFNRKTKRSYEAFKAECKRKHYKKELDVIIYDYIQQMTLTFKSKFTNKLTELEFISNDLKELSQDLNVPIILTAQLNREAESRGSGKVIVPMLSHLKNAGAFEQDSDGVILIHKFTDTESDDEKTFLRIAKNRFGKTGEFRIHSIPGLNMFGDFKE